MSSQTYADDTKTCVSHRLLEKVIEMLEEDARNVLVFMASNVLVANPKKTAFMVLNHTQNLESNPINIKIGNETVSAEESAKLLGIILDNNQKWKSQIQGIGGTISNLNSRLYLLRRLSRAISKDILQKISDSLFTSKIRYGIQLFGKVRINENDPNEALLESLQITQNKFARFLHGSTLMDRINTKTIYEETNLLSVNQINAQIKLSEVWKSMNNTKYPTQWTKRCDVLKREGLKNYNKPEIVIKGSSMLQSQTFVNDAANLWNIAPLTIKNCTSLGSAKKQIKIFVRSLPL